MIEENIDITKYTTFGIPVKARYFAEYKSEKELLKISRDSIFIDNEVLNIGGGSNLLFLGDYEGLVLHSGIKGMVRYDKNESTVYAIVGAGEKWEDFVAWTLENNLGGVENLAGIPGEVGAAPVQNVGAYGVEAGDLIFAVECFDTITRNIRRFSAEECKFGYRDSFFKNEGKGRYIVLRVSFLLRPDGLARNLEYGPLAKLESTLGHQPTIKEVADEVIKIRNSKLPNPSEIGSAGSFFKNPVIHAGRLHEIEALTGHKLTGYELANNMVKLSAAYLIDKAGLKGLRVGDAEVYKQQPLVIVNRGNATADDVKKLAEIVREEVRKEFLIDLRPEVNYISSKINVTILGSGTSKGVPEIGCDCRVCKSENILDKRTRTSALIEIGGMNILIDPSPDFRMQAIRENIYAIDAVIVTHSHYDHVGGIDDLRPFCASGDLPMYVREDVDGELRRHYDYCFKDHRYPGVPVFDMKIIGNSPFYIKGVKILPVEVMHGNKPIFGYRIGNFAYVTDAKTISPSELEKLEGLDVMVINALRDREHFSHLTLKEALTIIEEVKPKEAFLTHFNHEIGLHNELDARIPENVHPAYDGLKFSVSF